LGILLDFFILLVLILLVLGTVSLATTWALLKGLKPGLAVLSGALVMVIFSTAVFFLDQAGPRQDAVTQIQQYFDPHHFEEQWKLSISSLSKMGFDSGKWEPLKDSYRKYFYWSAPAQVLVFSLMCGLLAYYLVSSIFSRITPKIPKAISFREWMIPEPLVFGLIMGGILKLFAQYFNKDDSWLEILSNNLLVFFLGLYTLVGLSIISFYFYKWRLPAALRVLGYIVAFLFTLYSVCCLGVLDVWFDFRKLKTPPPTPEASV
jgi:uncharacterized protein YybS (DUF2232 family)